MSNVMLVILSFCASLGFAIVFHMRKEYLLYAGLGGALTRIVYLIMISFTDSRSIYVCVSAMFASFYAYFMAAKKHTPSTVFLYPSIIPLIPGDLLYYAMEGIVNLDMSEFSTYGLSLLVACIWMGIGFVIVISFMYYVKKFRKMKNQFVNK